MSNSLASVGVDAGGSWIRLRGLSSQGQSLKSHRQAAPPDGNLAAPLKRVLKQWGGRPERLVVASRGVWSIPERAAMTKKLRSLAPKVTVMSDVEAAWLAAFGDSSHSQGILVISGTGSIGLGRHPHGQWVRSGGLGPLLGDEGSAFWIGREWLRGNPHGMTLDQVLAHLRYPGNPVRTIAAWARKVITLAQKRDRRAAQIVQGAQRHLTDLVVHIVKKTRPRGAILVSWGGTVLDNPWFRLGFERELKRSFGQRARLITPSMDAAMAAAQHGLRP